MVRFTLINARLGRGLIFDDESAARGCASDAISDVHPTSEAGVRGGRQFWGKRRSGQSRVEGKRLSGYGSRIGVRRRKGVRKAKGPWRIKEDGGSSFFPHQIIDLLPHFLYRHLHSCILAAPTHPLYNTVALDSGSEAMYVRRQGRGLGIWPLAARCSWPCGSMPGLGPNI